MCTAIEKSKAKIQVQVNVTCQEPNNKLSFCKHLFFNYLNTPSVQDSFVPSTISQDVLVQECMGPKVQVCWQVTLIFIIK